MAAAGLEQWKATVGLHQRVSKKWSAKENVALKQEAETTVRKARREMLEANIDGGGRGGSGGV